MQQNVFICGDGRHRTAQIDVSSWESIKNMFYLFFFFSPIFDTIQLSSAMIINEII